ncbi:molybdate ABC transporter substrate-binding protein [Bacillus horti]|uniref:Molybdate transport system substrate-binding protein n=1 Tax=Caldalkalibacillus horti TaxID=77523 RepID=A0ABT9W3U3_9BACI|nr:molybdate ABC transporter substrate-binding protein [Bacillus horti]MDQ0167913.1 molybdate transport system substrate-binding protein [Bacillus horti]
MVSRKMKLIIILCFMTSVLLVAGCANSSSDGQVELHVMTAASMTNAMTDLIEMYKNEQENITIIPNYGSSGQLKTQIDQGAPADLFLSAAVRWVDELEAEDKVTEQVDYLRNDLVLVTHKNSDLELQSFEDLTNDNVQSVSIGQPETVPAGEYATQALENMQLFSELEPKIIFGSDVRQVLTYVQTGNVDAGLVYRTDAILIDDTEIALEVDHQLHDEIIYPIALLSSSDHPDEAKAFYEWLLTDEAIQIFQKYGFTGM